MSVERETGENGGGMLRECRGIRVSRLCGTHAEKGCVSCSFSNDPSLAPGALKVTTSLSSFIPPTHPPADAASVSHPFIVTIHYSRPSEAFRGLGHVLGVTRNLLRPASSSPSLAHPFLADLTGQWVLDPNVGVLLEREEKANFETLGTMIDCSRNGVLGVSSVKFLCRSLALMGYNML